MSGFKSTVLHADTFNYLMPTHEQVEAMQRLRDAASAYADALQAEVVDGPDKTYLLRKLREVAMWANVAVSRHSDGSPRVIDARESLNDR